MNATKVNNCKKLSAMIAESLVAAQCALWGLQAIHEVSKLKPDIEEQHPQLIKLIWRSIFDRLYIKIGTVVETSDGAANLKTLQKAAISLFESNPERKEELIKVSISSSKLDLLKMWRNKSVAHNDVNFNVNEFYAENKMHVSEYQPIIDELFEILNKISFLSTQDVFLKPAWSEIYQSEATSLFLADYKQKIV